MTNTLNEPGVKVSLEITIRSRTLQLAEYHPPHITISFFFLSWHKTINFIHISWTLFLWQLSYSSSHVCASLTAAERLTRFFNTYTCMWPQFQNRKSFSTPSSQRHRMRNPQQRNLINLNTDTTSTRLRRKTQGLSRRNNTFSVPILLPLWWRQALWRAEAAMLRFIFILFIGMEPQINY